MKKVLLTATLCMVVALSFAQKKAVKDAKSEMNSNNFTEARELIKPALTDPETANDAETWKVAGDIENKAFDTQRTNQMLQKEFKEDVMYDALLNSYAPYIKADELGQIPDEKGKVKNKFRKDIAATLKANHPFFINGGVYYNDKQDYNKASIFFEKYWELPSLQIFADDKDKINTSDSTFQTIKYYAVITAIQARDDQRAIQLLNKILSEPFTPNSTYKESDVYELLASEYENTKDSVNFVKTLELAAAKFPENKYFVPNLINQYIKAGKSEQAIAYLDKAIANNPEGACDMYSVKASLFAEKKDFTTADATYQTALSKDAACERALEGLAVSYIVQAQNLKEEAGNVSSAKERAELDDKAKNLYNKAFPLLEKYKSLLEGRKADEQEIKSMLVKLQNVYYNLNMEKEYEAVSAELEKYKY